MAGIIFFKTQQLEPIIAFYTERIGMTIWLKQADCVILKNDNMLLGFCQREVTDTCGMITFFYDTQEEVDTMYEKFKECSLQPPQKNDKYKIYHCFVSDPDGRSVEFQKFLHPTNEI